MWNLGQGYWECWRGGGTHTSGTRGEKTKVCSSIPTLSSSLVFGSELRTKTKNILKLKCGQPVAWSDFGEQFCSFTCKHFSAPIHILTVAP